MPVTPQHLAVEALVSLLASVEKVRVRLGTRTRLLGILLTMVDPSRPAASEIRERLRAQYRDDVFHTEILASRTLEEAPAAAQIDLPVRAPLPRGRRDFAGCPAKCSSAFAPSSTDTSSTGPAPLPENASSGWNDPRTGAFE